MIAHFFLYTAALCSFSRCSEQSHQHKKTTARSVIQIPDSIPGSGLTKVLKAFYDQYNVEGMMVIYDDSRKEKIVYNPGWYHKPTSPASTFNILLTWIGLKEGVLKNEKSALIRGDIKYTSSFGGDRVSLEEDFINNRDWSFIRLASLIGSKKIANWLEEIKYGNQSVASETNRFWINGELSTTPAQQIEFIQNFYYEKLPFSKKEYSVVKNLLWQKQTEGLNIYGKRGSNKIEREKRYTGWFVGYIKSAEKVYFLTNFIESPDLNHPSIVDPQKEIAYNVFEYLNLK